MDFAAELARAHNLVRETFRTLGSPQIYCEVKFSSRFSRRMGDARYDHVKQKGIIRLSAVLWPRATEVERTETIIHEACHVVQLYFYPTSAAHGREWAALMRKAGRKPQRCHQVDRTGIQRKNARVAASCLCGNVRAITTNKATRIRRGASYRCLKCNEVVSLA